jgi:hypothetical protein
LVFHGALYFIPMLIFYGGGRREEYCGMMTDDVIEDIVGLTCDTPPDAEPPRRYAGR